MTKKSKRKTGGKKVIRDDTTDLNDSDKTVDLSDINETVYMVDEDAVRERNMKNSL